MPPQSSQKEAATEEQKMSTFKKDKNKKKDFNEGSDFCGIVMRGITDFLLTNCIMLILLIVVVCWQTKVFGFYSTERINERKREDAASKMKFGAVDVKVSKTNEEGANIKGGDYVTAHVTGYDQRGLQFFSTRNKKQANGPMSVAVSSGTSMFGIEDALLHMRVGETATVTIPPDLAFGSRGKRSWGIEPWSILTLEISVLSASKEKPEDEPEIPIARREPKKDEQPDAKTATATTKSSTPTSTPTPSPSTSPLAAFLEKSGLGKFQEKLEHIGLTSLEDFSLLEPGDLPEDMPTFAKKKMLSIAKKLRAEGTVADEKPAAETAAATRKETVEADSDKDQKEQSAAAETDDSNKEQKKEKETTSDDTCSSNTEGTC